MLEGEIVDLRYCFSLLRDFIFFLLGTTISYLIDVSVGSTLVLAMRISKQIEQPL